MSSNKNIKYGFRMVHIDNIPHIKEYGFILYSSSNASKSYKPIGDSSIINKRTVNKFN